MTAGDSRHELEAAKSVLGADADWIRVTKHLATCPESEFKHFRRDPTLLRAVEGTRLPSALHNLTFFFKNPNHPVTAALGEIAKSDRVGNPLDVVAISGLGGARGLNPTTLRYAKNWANIWDLFGLHAFSGGAVAEIGAGYGGDAKVFFDLLKQFELQFRASSFDVYDLPTSKGLIARFLGEFGYRANFRLVDDLPADRSPSAYSLVISNGALSEMRGPLLERYVEALVVPASRGYFIVNFDSHSKPFEGGWSDADFFDRLKQAGKNPVWMDTARFLTPWDLGKSKLLVFGADSSRIRAARSSRVENLSPRKTWERIISVFPRSCA